MSFRHWVGPALLVTTGVAMLAWSWGKWLDVLIDFGRELYVPWRLYAGQRLYVDLDYYFGPLSPFLNAVWFRLFGVSLHTLVLANLGLTILFTLGLYRLLRILSDRLSAVVACAAFLTLFAMAKFVPNGNYNFLCPYAHEMTHGVILGVFALSAFGAYLRTGRMGWAAASGGVLGATFLTKPEMFLGTLAGVGVGFMLTCWDACRSQQGWRALAVCGMAAAVPPLLALGMLALAIPVDVACKGVLGGWRWLGGHNLWRLASFPFYRYWSGLDDAGASVHAMGRSAIEGALLVGVGLLFTRLARGRRAVGWLPAGLVLGVGVVLTRLWGLRESSDVGRALPVVILLLGGGWVWRVVQSYRTDHCRHKAILGVSVSTFAFVLLGKMLLFSRIYNYGFVLALPATMLAVVASLYWLPALVRVRGGDGARIRLAMLAFLMVGLETHLEHIAWAYRSVRYPVARGADAFLADARGVLVNEAVQSIQRRLQPGDTLVVLPDGIMLNYLTRRVSSVPYLGFQPFQLLLYGEATVLTTLSRHPPDYVALVHVDAAEQGARFFGRDYGQQLYAWIRQHYQDEELIGEPPLRDERFGILLMRRRQARGEAPPAHSEEELTRTPL